MQLRIWHIARSVMSNWFATVATLIVGFFLAPFIVHQLGNLAYGVWVLAISSINYMAILDLGMASSVIRFVSKGHATKDHNLASEALSAVLWVRMQISGVILLGAVLLAIAFPHLFKVPAELIHDARVALLIIGVTTTISMSFGVFSSTLSALHRYDLRSIVTLVELSIRATGVVYVLRSGHGIVAIACCELVTAVVGKALLAYLAHKAYPELRIGLGRPAGDVLRRIWSYSVYAFLVTIAVQIVYQTDNLVVGAFVSATAVTFYSIGNSLCRYTEQMVGAMTTTFTPAASTYEAAGDVHSLRSLYFNGTRATMAITLPVTVTLIIRGGSFISVWMGPQYAHISGGVLSILAVALTFALQNSTAVAIAFGVEKHKMLAKWSLGEAFANLTLSVILAHKIGLYGVAIGTLVPSLVVQLVLWPRYVSRVVDVTLTQVLWNTWGPMFVCIAPFAVASYAVNIYFPPNSKLEFFLQTFALLPIFGVMLAVVFREKVKRQILPRVRSYLYARSA